MRSRIEQFGGNFINETEIGKKSNWPHGLDTAAKDCLKAYINKAMDHWAHLIRQRRDAADGK